MKIKKIQLEIISFVIVVGALFFTFPSSALADGISLKVSPSLFEIQAKPPADVWAPFTIENQSNQPVNLIIGYKAFDPQASQNGKVAFLKNGQQISGEDKKIFEKIQVVDDNNISHSTLSLGPKQTERFRLHITIPINEPSDDYYFSLIFLQSQNTTSQSTSKAIKSNQDSFSTIQGGIGSNILLAVGDKEIPEANIENFSTSWVRDSGPVPFNLTVFNEGLHFINPSGIILIKNMFGQTIGKITIPPSVILAGTGRTLTSNSFQDYANNTIMNQNDTLLPQLIWPKHFLLGMYTATLTFSLSNSGPTYTRSIHFFVFPFNYLIDILITAVVIFLIYIRVKRKLR